ncbi:hypothetical protein KJY73_13285 [Bowmanella sp. Y26]|uniref:hypothetical protein n=1 Tax=Bowmanella yangjiangensis TaxID=2811230 RepID=UPI001BDC8FC1|nr:hypothetical protein [Bowmanella yangjiangensis]MBT1064557.1 hypothetical protein [Bowmanella yangjiangensis]
MKSLWPGWRRILNVSSSASLAGANLTLSLLLLWFADAAEFGSFAMLQVSTGLAYGISNALLGSPLLLFLKEKQPDEGQLRGFFSASLLLAALLSAGQVLITLGLAAAAPVMLWASMLVFCGTLRWFGRNYALSVKPALAVSSDLTTSVLMLIGALLLWAIEWITLQGMLLVCAIAQCGGLIALGRTHASLLMTALFRREWNAVKHGVNQQGKAALTGALSVEATTNGHSYLISLLAGPAAFAPIAAAALLFRPCFVVQGALASFERPRLVQLLAAQDSSAVRLAARQMMAWSALLWAGNALLVIALLIWPSHGLWEAKDNSMMLYLCLLWGAIVLLRSVRLTPSLFAQANDQFGLLAKACVTSALVTLPLLLVMILTVDVNASLYGLIVGEVIILAWLYPTYRRLLNSQATEVQSLC